MWTFGVLTHSWVCSCIHLTFKSIWRARFPRMQVPSFIPNPGVEHLGQPSLLPSPISCESHRSSNLLTSTCCFVPVPTCSKHTLLIQGSLLPGQQIGWQQIHTYPPAPPDPVSGSHPQLCSRLPAAVSLSSLTPASPPDHKGLLPKSSFPQIIQHSQLFSGNIPSHLPSRTEKQEYVFWPSQLEWVKKQIGKLTRKDNSETCSHIFRNLSPIIQKLRDKETGTWHEAKGMSVVITCRVRNPVSE